MPYFVNDKNEQVRIDDAGNFFLGKKCMNGKTSPVNWAKEIMERAVQDGTITEGIAVTVTGHVPVFEYGHTRDEKGNPVSVKVNTGNPAL